MPFRVSIVGRDRPGVEAIARNLTQKGHTCSIADENDISAGILAGQSPDIVLVESDSTYRIAELAPEIRETNDVPIVALVRAASLGRVNDHLNDVDDFVASPFPPDELHVRIMRLLGRTAAEAVKK